MTQFESNVAGSLDIAQTAAIDNKNTSLEPIHLVFGLLKNWFNVLISPLSRTPF